ncbi:MAG: S8 family serine peptidase [Crocinitomicaceae bacterium]|nr:S8 family serine peptidase [Crocinitomicaceae bacterium]
MKKKKFCHFQLFTVRRSSLFILYLFMLSVTTHICSQELPKHYVVRFNHSLLNPDAVNNAELREGKLTAFLNGRGKKTADSLKKNGLDFGSLVVSKLFPEWNTTDTISISRQGNTVWIPPFWATFVVSVPEDAHAVRFFETMRRAQPLTVYIDPPLSVNWLGVPDDTLYNYQQSLLDNADFVGGINVESAWEIETGKRHIKVGIFDSGVDSSHQDIRLLTGETHWTIGSDPIGRWGSDVVGHGTSVAGIIGARRNNTTGVAGIAAGSGHDTTGVSLLDFKVGGHPSEVVSDFDGNMVSAGIINAARSVGSYYDWFTVMGGNYDEDDYYLSHNMPGYGVHINNHSYSVSFEEPRDEERDLTGDPPTGWGEVYVPTCHLCDEAYLFALQNGVINVIARGNGTNYSLDPTTISSNNIPQRYDDSWVISVGASGTDGKRLIDTGNTGPESNAPGEQWYSAIGLNMDLLAPGSLSNVATLRSSGMLPDAPDLYQKFSGTSAAAPHVTGVIALMLSYYNKPCYSNQNLAPADVEYILQKSATDIGPVGYDDTSGHGLLDALKALQLIEYPKYQIIHPQSAPTQIELVEHDTIHIYLDDPIYANWGGPIGSNFLLELNKTYRVEKRTYQITYNFSEYLQFPLSSSSVELLDVWVRHSQTNSLRGLQDTVDQIPLIIDTFQLEPDAQIIQLDPVAGTITLRGFYYQFLLYYDDDHGGFNNESIETNIWYPINPNLQVPKMAYSIYLYDSLATGIDFPCYADNPLVDEAVSVNVLEEESFCLIHPNPGNNQLTIQLQANQFIEQVQVLDVSGRVTATIVGKQTNTIHIATDQLQIGSYIVVISLDNGKILTKKWIKL